MLRSYIKVALRHLRKNAGYTTINIAGLAIGMAVALLIGFWIVTELNYNHYFPNHQRIAKGMITQYSRGESYSGEVIAMPMGKALREKYPDLFKRTALAFPDGSLVSYGEKKLSVPVLWAQRELPDMFGFRIVRGSLASLKDASTTLISQSMAASLFGQNDPVGKTLRINNSYDLHVGGVYADIPENNDFHDLQMIMPWENVHNAYHRDNTEWEDHNGNLYVEMAGNATTEQANARIQKLPTPFIPTWREEAFVYPLDRFHLYDSFTNGKPDGKGGIQIVWMFAIIGAFVLILACINFMNLSTARSAKRAREVGIRKTLGSLRQQLISQFLSESLLLASLAFMLALMLVGASLPLFGNLAGKHLTMPWTSLPFWTASLTFVLVTGLLAGSYPAFYLSRFDPIRVLKGTFRAGRFASLPRHVLVVLQFTVSLALIIGTTVVFRQIQYTKDRPVGYDRTGLLTIPINTADMFNHYDALRHDLISKGLASNVAASSQSITQFNNNNVLHWQGKQPDQESIFFRNINVSYDWGPTIGWHVLKGRDFSRDFPTDSSAIILNAAAVKVIGRDPIGETMQMFGKSWKVIGVVDDMVTNSPYERVEPAVFLGNGYISTISIRLKPGGNVHDLLSGIGAVVTKYNPSSPFIYQFMDDQYGHKFRSEERIGDVAAFFTTLAILISCLGLFGLASFIAEQRTKEIGVRKVLGANVLRLWGLLSQDFVRLAAISLFIAIPIAWFAMNKWLLNFSYRAPLSWWIFAASALGLMLLTLLTVSYQSLKAALANPVNSLRTE